MKRRSLKDIIKQSNVIHDNKYDYSKVKEYKNNSTPYPIICKEHGVFNQSFDSHLMGRGCPKCGRERVKRSQTKTQPQAIKDFRAVHGNKYDYSKVNYVNSTKNVEIVCKQHGSFFQTPKNHLKKRGCPECGKIERAKKRSYSKEDFLNLVGEDYDYSKVVYNKSSEKVEIVCKEHGSFWQSPNNHISKNTRCPRCTCSKPSKKEDELVEFLKGSFQLKQSYKKLLEGKELDIYIPSKKVAIEFDGLYWHSDKFKPDSYHLDKTKLCKTKGVDLIHIFEDEWDFKSDIVKSRLQNILGNTPNRVYARKTEVREVSTKEKSKFLDDNHIQGKVGSKVNLGLYFKGDLVAIMTFGKLRKNLGQNHKEGHWELLRFCNKLNTTVIGGASKLLSYFKKNYDWREIISYADRRWSKGQLYEQLGFKKVSETKPNYFYIGIKKLKRSPRYKYRKSELVKQGFSKDDTERSIMKSRGYKRIYDCGTLKYKLIKTKTTLVD